MSKNVHKRDWTRKSLPFEEAETIPLQELSERRAEKHLTNLQTMLKEISAFQRNHKVDENITLSAD